MKYFYRIQRKCGQGPYDYQENWYNPNRFSHADSSRHPAPWADKRLKQRWWLDDNALFYFGFVNMKQLRRWFSPTDLKNLEDLGFNIIRINRKDCLEIVESDHQLMFKRKVG